MSRRVVSIIILLAVLCITWWGVGKVESLSPVPDKRDVSAKSVDDEFTAHPAILSFYEFLNGDLSAYDPDGSLWAGRHSIWQITSDSVEQTEYALFDMDGDGIPELHIRPTIGSGYAIYRYQDGDVVLWHLNVAYCHPLNNGALLYVRRGVAPEHTNYIYITLDADGKEVFTEYFAIYDLTSEEEPSSTSECIYTVDNQEVSEEEWNSVAEKYLAIGADDITWLVWGGMSGCRIAK